MLKIFLLIFALTLISPKTIPSIKAGMNTTFDYNHQEFNFDYRGPGKDEMLMYINTGGWQFDYYIDCELFTADLKTFEDEFIGFMDIYYKNSPCYIRFSSSDGNKEAKGSFVIYGYKTPLSIKLKNKYGNVNLSTYFTVGLSTKYEQLTFSVPNLERNATVIFKYNPKNIKYANLTIDNPFKVCHKNSCKEYINTYDFKKGESYKIYVKMTRIKDAHYHNSDVILVPGFTFYDQNYNGTFSPDDIIDEDASNNLKIKLLFISLIILLL